MADIVDDFFACLALHVPDLPIESRAELEKTIRSQWGGRKPYVAKKVNRITRAAMVASGLRQKKSISQSFAFAGVCTRDGYRLLGRVVPNWD